MRVDMCTYRCDEARRVTARQFNRTTGARGSAPQSRATPRRATPQSPVSFFERDLGADAFGADALR
jgi:hypothetical protein